MTDKPPIQEPETKSMILTQTGSRAWDVEIQGLISRREMQHALRFLQVAYRNRERQRVIDRRVQRNKQDD